LRLNRFIPSPSVGEKPQFLRVFLDFGDFPHVQYAFYLRALDARRAVKCGMASVTWYDVTANHRRAAHSIPHFTFRIPHATVPHFTHSIIN